MGSVSDCESFEENLTALGEAIEVDVSLERMWISEKIGELETYEEEKTSHEYETWKDNRHSNSDSAPSIDELFNTLGGSAS